MQKISSDAGNPLHWKAPSAAFVGVAVFNILTLLPPRGWAEAPPSSPRPKALAPPSAASPLPSEAPTARKPKPIPGNQVVWEHWYTVTAGVCLPGSPCAPGEDPKGRPYAYYQDRLEKTPDGKLFFQNRFWKREEDFINEEALGAIAEAEDLAPIAFNFYRSYRGTTLRVDGTAQAGRLKTGTTEAAEPNEAPSSAGSTEGRRRPPLIRERPLPKKTLFSVFFPVWLARQELKPGGSTISFRAVLEDDQEGGFPLESGTVRLAEPVRSPAKPGSAKAPPAGLETRRRVEVNFRSLKSTWFLAEDGLPVRIEMPAQRLLVLRASSPTSAREAFEKDDAALPSKAPSAKKLNTES